MCRLHLKRKKSFKSWYIINGCIWLVWVVILETIHFTDIIQVAWLLWQGMERVEKKGKHTFRYFAYFKVLLATVDFVLILFSSFTLSAFTIYSDCDSVVLHACTYFKYSCILFGTVGWFWMLCVHCHLKSIPFRTGKLTEAQSNYGILSHIKKNKHSSD